MHGTAAGSVTAWPNMDTKYCLINPMHGYHATCVYLICLCTHNWTCAGVYNNLTSDFYTHAN